jgi:hypothetical protein
MSQLNIHMTPLFEHTLREFMKVRHISTKAEAVRTAIQEGLDHAACGIKKTDFSSWAGLANQAPENKNPKFSSDDDLWK